MPPISGFTLWVVLAVAAAILEMATAGFGFIFVTAAAGVAALLAALELPAAVQVGAFGVATLLGLLFLRPRFAARMAAKGHVPSRTDRLVGQHGRVTEALDPIAGSGRVLVAGEDWAARADAPLPVDAEIVVTAADGIVLIVRPAQA
jgi:membrane protein implicated in regulation of membrane protease activity